MCVCATLGSKGLLSEEELKYLCVLDQRLCVLSAALFAIYDTPQLHLKLSKWTLWLIWTYLCPTSFSESLFSSPANPQTR